MKIIYCQDCKIMKIEADYLLKDGKDFIPLCNSCAADQALEGQINNNEIVELCNLDDEEMEEFEEKYGCDL